METITTQSITLDKLHRLATDNGFSFVSYRLPSAPQPVTMVQWSSAPVALDTIDQLSNYSGFVFAPFDFLSGLPMRVIQPDLIIHGDDFTQVENLQPEIPASIENISHRSNYITRREEFMSQVKQVQCIIDAHTIEKVVLSRICRETLPRGFDSAMMFDSLVQAYPDAFVFVVYIPDAGIWIGASPEPLLLARHGMVSTVSLAGTRKVNRNTGKLPWGEKELDEQHIVTQYIDGILSKHNITGVDKTGPESYRAGKIEHIRTLFSFPLPQKKDFLPEFLSELHPTPSVCGLPKDISLQVIRDTEKHQREYYSGFLGPVDTDSRWDLYVNLRSMKVLDKHLEYYLGAGITKGSRAEDEWEETHNKMNTMKSIVESLK
jgi:isochorismate synthase